MADTEDYFPRGGKKPSTTYFKQSGNFLGAAEKSEKKKKKQKKKSDADDGYLSDDNFKNINKSFKSCASRLSLKTIKQGVVILGRVKYVQETKLTVCLPGNMLGAVMACHVSETYNKMLEAYVNDETEKIKELPEMFHPGQYVIVKVLEVEGSKLMLSMMPQHIYSGRTHTDLQKGEILQAAVSSEEDHGYVMDIGIPNTRPFLPKKNTNPEIELEAGMVTWCCIKSLTQSSDSCIVKLSGELSALQSAAPPPPPRQKPALLMPATTVYFTVDQIKARVLYVMPTRNTPFLTMKDIFEKSRPDLETEQLLKEGDIIDDAKVVKILGRSVQFRLRDGCAGTMSLKHVAVHEDLDDEQVVASFYPIGSCHRVRVTSYNPCDFLYTVSDRADVLAERYFTLAAISVGQIVDATVRQVTDSHLLVDVGRTNGYIPKTHFSDAGIFVDPKKASHSKLTKKFKPGQTLRARVLVVDKAKNSLLLTLKPTLLAEDLEILSSYEQAQVGKGYTGFIRVVRDYIVVSFFNNVSAYVPRHYVTKEPLESLQDAFHLGQIVNCTILRVDAENKKMGGSLTTVPFWPAIKREKIRKRKSNSDDSDELPNKKRKQSDRDEKSNERVKKEDTYEENNDVDDKKKTKKDKKKKESHIDEELTSEQITKKSIKSKEIIEEDDEKTNKKEKKTNKKKKKGDSDEMNKVSEESDAIETDIHEDSDQVLTPEDLFLIDLSDCNDIHKCKKRIVSLTKNINARMRRIERIDEKIQKIENVGLNAKNKKFHTAMHMEKLVIEERI
ncbi:unnamed protein product, partial [Diatraea saccharalis]